MGTKENKKTTMTHRRLFLLLTLALLTSTFCPKPLAAQPSIGFGSTLFMTGISPFGEFGSFIPLFGVRASSYWLLGKEPEPKAPWLSTELGFLMSEGLFLDAGLLWPGRMDKKLSSRYGFSVGAGMAGFESEATFSGRLKIRYEPMILSVPDKKSNVWDFSFLGMSIGAIFSNEPRLNGVGFDLSLVDTTYRFDGNRIARQIPARFAELSSMDGRKGNAFLLETSISLLPIYIWLPLPFTEWSFGYEIVKGGYSASVMARINAVMIFLDGYKSMRLELCPARLRIGIWRPAVTFGVSLTELYSGIMGINYSSDARSDIINSFDVIIEPLCFDLRTKPNKELRISILPLSSSLLLEAPIYNFIRIGWRL